jgi:hypothetical protein
MSALDWAARPYEEWTDDDLLSCVRWWAAELGLDSWKISAKFVRYRDADESWARARTHENYETAEVEVVRWADREGCDHPGADDLEVSVVHELVHVRFWSANSCFFDAGSVAKSTYEAAIERTALALVRLRKRAAR